MPRKKLAGVASLKPVKHNKNVPTYSIPKEIRQEISRDTEGGADSDILVKNSHRREIRSREDEYKKRKYAYFEEQERKETEANDGAKDEEAEKKTKAIKEDPDEDPVEKAMRRKLQARKLAREKIARVVGRGRAESEDTKNDEAMTTEDGDKTPTRNEFSVSNDEDGDKTPTRNDTPTADDSSDTPPRKSRKIDTDRRIEISLKIPVIDGIKLSDTILDQILPPGFKTVPVPKDYTPRDLDLPDFSTFNPVTNTDGYLIPEESHLGIEARVVANPQLIEEVPGMKDLAYFKESDMAVFGKLITTRKTPDEDLSPDELNERICMKLILKVKNLPPGSRRGAMHQFTDKLSSFDPKCIFDIVLPLLMSKDLEEEERHVLVKIISRSLFALEKKVRPYTKKILVVIMPLLMDDSRFSRDEGRTIISNLVKAVGLSPIITVLRPDVDHSDEYVRNLVARTLAVVCSSVGVHTVLPFILAICKSQKSRLAQQTGLKTVQWIARFMGSRILPNLDDLMDCVLPNLTNDDLSVRSAAALAVGDLAESSKPYGFESLQPALDPLMDGIKRHRSRSLAAFLKAIGTIIPLMDEEYSNYYARQVFGIMSREFSSPDFRMKTVILQIIETCCSIPTISPKIVLKNGFLDDFFQNFWTRRSAMDGRLARICVSASCALSMKAGTSDIIERILPSLKDGSEAFRKMAISTCRQITLNQGGLDLSDRAVTRVLDGLLYALQHQSDPGEDKIVLEGFGSITKTLGIRMKNQLMPIVSALLYRLKHKDSGVREQAADMINEMAPILSVCDEEELLIRLGTILYEALGEVYPEVLGSILAALRSVLANIKSIDMVSPPISQVLSTLTPILRNKHEKVQETVINLIGDIVHRAKDYINQREWLRISFELLDMLKSSRKSIRISTNNTFGLIAEAIGPSDVLVTLLNNLRMQERQLRVCTAVAIGIVAKVCLPYTVLPVMMNEYRYPDKNVQNGILKSMAFMFSYIGDVGSDYIYATTPLLVDALNSTDLVHQQTAASVIEHMALQSAGFGSEDAFLYFLDMLWPNIFETSPHVLNQVLEAIESLRIVLGCGVIMNYLVDGLFHPSRKVRHAYWRVYNRMYISSAHAMVPFYPRMERIGEEVKPQTPHIDDHPKDLGVSELDIWI